MPREARRRRRSRTAGNNERRGPDRNHRRAAAVCRHTEVCSIDSLGSLYDMPPSIPEFWQLLEASQLVTADQCRQLAAAFGQAKLGAAHSNVRTLAEWLISRGVLTRYQTAVLMAGRAGPFLYGPYRLYDRLAGGAAAGMFRAVHVATQHPVVLQFLTGPATQDAAQWAALAPQLKIYCGVQHPHLQRCYEVVDLTTYRFLVVEDLRGHSLDQTLVGGQRWAPPEACRAIRCAALGLMPLHQRGMMHGDIRPARLWLEQGGNIKLSREPISGLTRVHLSQPDPDGTLAARADYLAPGFLQDGKSPDALTDIYALGCTLYELLAGRPPFPAADLRTKMQLHATQPIESLEPLGVPAPLMQVVAYMMAKNPAVRYQHLNQLIAQISPFVDPSRSSLASPPPPATLAAYERAIQRQPDAVGAAARAARANGPRDAAGEAQAGLPAGLDPLGAASAEPGDSILKGRERYTPARQKLFFQLGLAAGVVLLALSALVWLNSSTGRPPLRPHAGRPARLSDDTVDAAASGSAADTPRTAAAPSGPPRGDQPPILSDDGRFEIVPDDGRQPWLSPTAGQAISLRYAPPGAQCFLIARPADLLASPAGPRILRALGPAFAAVQAEWEAALGLPLADVGQLTVCFQDGGDPLPRATLIARPRAPMATDELLKRWRVPASTASEANEYTGPRGWSYYVPPDTEDGAFVVGRAEQIREIRDAQGAAPAMTTVMERLVRASDDQRHVTVLFSPHEVTSNFFRDGRPWTLCPPRQIREPLGWFLGDGLTAVGFSLHAGDPGYVELTFVPRSGVVPGSSPVAEIPERLRQAPDLLERHLARLNPSPSWRIVAARFPRMMRFLVDHTRFGVEDDLAVCNVALPASALHNLVFATQMTLRAASSGDAGPTPRAAPQTDAPVTVAPSAPSADAPDGSPAGATERPAMAPE